MSSWSDIVSAGRHYRSGGPSPRANSTLVYLDTHILQSGQNAFSVMPPDVAEARRKLAHEFSGGVLLPPPEPAALGVTNPADVAWVKEKMTPHPVSTLEDALNLKSPVGNGLPITYIAVRPYFAPAATSRAFAKKQKGWRYLELDAGHDAMVTSPETLTELLATI